METVSFLSILPFNPWPTVIFVWRCVFQKIKCSTPVMPLKQTVFNSLTLSKHRLPSSFLGNVHVYINFTFSRNRSDYIT